MLWCCVFTEVEIIRISNTKLEFEEEMKKFLERKKYFAIVHGFLNERARYLRDRIYSDITNLWVYEHSIVLEKCCPKLWKDAKQIQLYETEIAALH